MEPVRIPPSVLQPGDPFVCALEEAEEVLRGVGFGRALRPFLGEIKERHVSKLLFGEPLEGNAIGIKNPAGGFLFRWALEKPDACGDAKPFVYHVSAYVAGGVRRSRALETILNAFRGFMEHELREGFMFETSKPFNPHPRIET